MARVEVVIGDITRLELDGIVNAANQALLGGAASTAPFIALPDRSCSWLVGRFPR